LRLVMEQWSANAVVDFAVQAMADSTNLAEIEGLLDAGAISIELITPDATGHLLDEILRTVHEHGGLAGISVPDGGYAQFARQQLQNAGRHDIAAWLSTWPSVNEAVGVARILVLTEGTPYQFHIQMVTTKKAVDLLRNAKSKGRHTFTVETSPNYLLLTEDDHLRLGPWGMIHPRFKSSDDVAAVWDGVLDGTIDMIDTDHAPHARSEKEAGHDDVWKAPPGIPEIELSLRLMLNEVHRGRLTLPKLTALMAEAQARRYGLYPRKGTVDIGSDADLVIVDMDCEYQVDDSQLVTAPKYSAFHGTRLRGTPVVTLLRGEVIARDGSVVDARPGGQLVRGRR
jgi:allantoinase